MESEPNTTALNDFEREKNNRALLKAVREAGEAHCAVLHEIARDHGVSFDHVLEQDKTIKPIILATQKPTRKRSAFNQFTYYCYTAECTPQVISDELFSRLKSSVKEVRCQALKEGAEAVKKAWKKTEGLPERDKFIRDAEEVNNDKAFAKNTRRNAVNREFTRLEQFAKRLYHNGYDCLIMACDTYSQGSHVKLINTSGVNGYVDSISGMGYGIQGFEAFSRQRSLTEFPELLYKVIDTGNVGKIKDMVSQAQHAMHAGDEDPKSSGGDNEDNEDETSRSKATGRKGALTRKGRPNALVKRDAKRKQAKEILIAQINKHAKKKYQRRPDFDAFERLLTEKNLEFVGLTEKHSINDIWKMETTAVCDDTLKAFRSGQFKLIPKVT